ncbi:MAG: sugar transferase [Saprospiraceae bacterium]|nr:sugar transferase [Saprospiraceae bacterium]HMX87870.1 sugar transferase [Saprospiraceae bacterium]HMZ39718.1 sugar transferase [Saprospiraceae bacterium]HNA64261.1 sugar transferase [Saprospiraceae bacterium]HNB30338.1 sugar transferase [Saprospiraceae bacterium]
MTSRANILYIIFDLAIVAALWYLFCQNLIENGFMVSRLDAAQRYCWLGIVLIPSLWGVINFLSSQYRNIYRLSRWTIAVSTFGNSVVFSAIILVGVYRMDASFVKMSEVGLLINAFLIFVLLTEAYRLIVLSFASRQLREGKVGFNTIIIGGDQKALELLLEIRSYRYSLGHRFIGYLDSNGGEEHDLGGQLPHLGHLRDLRNILEQNKVEEVLIAIESTEHGKLKNILDILFEFGDNLIIRTIPDTYDILLGTVKMNYLYGAVLIEIRKDIMPLWQQYIKRLMDIILSFSVLVVFSPVILLIIIRTAFANNGKVLYSQERIGQYGKSFLILKFQSMVNEAEATGPQLSSDSDPRVTSWGKIMRKWRLDEIPQFYNVLRGDMSLVGPRPERRYFIDQIIQRAPHYKHLLKVRPGITSWGQVKYGYASSIDEMIQRLKYDILYVENMSLSLDFKIIFYTVLVLFQGKGK